MNRAPLPHSFRDGIAAWGRFHEASRSRAILGGECRDLDAARPRWLRHLSGWAEYASVPGHATVGAWSLRARYRLRRGLEHARACTPRGEDACDRCRTDLHPPCI